MNARKLLLWFVTLSVVVGVFLAYNHFFGTPPMEVGGDTDTVDIEPKNFVENASGISGVKIGDMKKQARFVDLDEETKKVTRVFGYSELLNPDQGTDNWKLNKPYMRVFGEDSQYIVTSERGTVRVEDVAGKV
ncbi:MAG: hypothetical protein KAR47_05410, partial [Planctomycetes bacterium]|nr:hypothetical protein [Planctomycetota bacterium]